MATSGWENMPPFIQLGRKSAPTLQAVPRPSFLTWRNASYPEAATTFKPLIPAGDHPEYPSGSSTIYIAFVQAGDDWFKKRLGFENASSNTGPLSFTIPAGKFYWTD
eukprot:CAMPEP_0201696842 /NCGR_PEP_ID=MMETSP0578-20130828/8360_1 /ASSEMBLY_ACC=CAM_ASM_000663 /TAXON_ID=267565 /ORGANISM="Skeletonema grethea, Strain CCMP 1804" /LENGTH=106 /DNA_ID=CAMNT_0048182873 /DNA_START=88 /DNA_END=408 /DNA_ORIENTATION=-